jgi:hypothetical protein
LGKPFLKARGLNAVSSLFSSIYEFLLNYILDRNVGYDG